MKKLIKCFCIVLFLSLHCQTCTMEKSPTESVLNVTIGSSWVQVDRPQAGLSDDNNTQPPASGNYFDNLRDISRNTAVAIAAVPTAAIAVNDLLTTAQNPQGTSPASPEQLLQQQAHSQKQLESIDNILKTTNNIFGSFTQALTAGTQLAQHATEFMQTLQTDPANRNFIDKDKQEARDPNRNLASEHVHINFLESKVIAILGQTNTTINGLTSLIEEVNTGIATYERIIKAKSPPSLGDPQVLRNHELSVMNQYTSIAEHGSTICSHLANTAKSVENIFNSANFASHTSHLSRVTTDTSVRLALTGAGVYLFCKNIQNADQKKYALLAGLGGAMMISPLVLARLTT